MIYQKFVKVFSEACSPLPSYSSKDRREADYQDDFEIVLSRQEMIFALYKGAFRS